MPAKLILLFIAVICAAAFFAAVFLRNLQIPAIALALLILSSVLIGAAWPAVLEQFSVRPNANQREAVSIQRNIDATRQAFAITPQNVGVQPYAGTTDQSAASVQQAITNDQATVPNIRLLDPNRLSRTFTQLEQRRNFYGFAPTLDVDRYTVTGAPRTTWWPRARSTRTTSSATSRTGSTATSSTPTATGSSRPRRTP